MGVSAQAVHKWENGGKLDADRQCELAELFDVSPSWLIFGEGDIRDTFKTFLRDTFPAPASEEGNAPVPLMEPRFMLKWLTGNGSNAPADVEWRPCPTRHGPRAYALRVTDDSMECLGSRVSYSIGDLLFIDPELPYRSGTRVALLTQNPGGDPVIIVREIFDFEGKLRIKALNPALAGEEREMFEHELSCGTVTGKWTEE